MNLPKSVAAFGTDAFDEICSDEVFENITELSLQDYCLGGMAVEAEADVHVDWKEEDEGTLSIHVTVYFDQETYASCCEQSHRESKNVEFLFTVDMATGCAGFEKSDYCEIV